MQQCDDVVLSCSCLAFCVHAATTALRWVPSTPMCTVCQVYSIFVTHEAVTEGPKQQAEEQQANIF